VLKFGSVKVKFTVNVIFLQTSVLRAMLQVKVADQKVLLVAIDVTTTVAVATDVMITAVREIVAAVEARVKVVQVKAVQVEIIEAETLLTEVLVNN
jgi:hypothetical protein